MGDPSPANLPTYLSIRLPPHLPIHHLILSISVYTPLPCKEIYNAVTSFPLEVAAPFLPRDIPLC